LGHDHWVTRRILAPIVIIAAFLIRTVPLA